MPEQDAQLVQRARDGDAEAFEALVRRHLRPARAVALAVLGDADDADDVSQQALLLALERLEQCRQPERFGAWLMQIVRNQARNHRRDWQRANVVPVEEAELTSGEPSPAREAERAQLRDHLRAGLETLSEVQREVVLLHDLEQWKHREIAAMLELPEGTVRYHLSLARRALRAWLTALSPREE